VNNDVMRLRAMVATPDGKRIARAEVNGSAVSPEALGQEIARVLEAQDAQSILAACKTE
jgi:hydroxymethylbilane synthase